MKTLISGLTLTTCLVATAIAAEPKTAILVLDAGAHDRRETPIVTRLPDGFPREGEISLERLTDQKTVAVQWVPGREPMVCWILEEPLRAESTRKYRLRIGAGAIGERPRGGVGLANRDGALTVELDGRAVLRYHENIAEPPAGISPIYRRSGFLHPLSTRTGRVVTDDFPPDHAHQHGVFLAWVDTTFDGRPHDFWNQIEQTGQVHHDEILGRSSGPVLAQFEVRLHHEALHGRSRPELVLEEVWNVRVYDVPGLVMVDLDSEQRCAGPKSLYIKKYLYGGLGLRCNRQWYDAAAKDNDPPAPARSGESDFLTSEGNHRSDGNHTRPRWADLSGKVDGKFAGLSVLDHPGNFRFPQPVRLHPNKPYFSVSPAVLGGFEIKPGKLFVSRYRFLVHDGRPDPEAIDRAWRDYADPPVVRWMSGD